MIARFHPQKDHQGFVTAARLLHDSRPDTRFVLCGEHMTEENQLLQGWLREAGLLSQFILLGRRDDVNRVTAALDLACSSAAWGEAFPNVLIEAMACEVPCVTTDVGDSAYIVGDTGVVIPPRDPVKLSEALRKLIDLPMNERRRMGREARKRVIQRFQLDTAVERFQSVYRGIVGRTTVPQRDMV
jgi:glycosyltransferase involved in cell wall biosynthesis